MSRPNILFLMTDQHRWDAMGCSGGWVRTPNLDRLAAEGVRFERAITTSPMCVSARVTMATGWYPHTTAVWRNIVYTLPADGPSWMRDVRDLGYRTSLFGKTHLHPHTGGDLRDGEHLLHAYGLDDVDEIGGPHASGRQMSHMTAKWAELGLLDAYIADIEDRAANKRHVVRPSPIPLEHYADVYVGQRAKHYLETYDHDQPWFCWVSFGGPHEPWDSPSPYDAMYEPEEMPAPVVRDLDPHDRPRGWLDVYMQHGSPRFEPGEELRLRANYAGNVTLIDDQIGEILDVIASRGELDNTVIVFTSDHGEMNGDWGLLHKMNFLDGALRVPMIVRTPATVEAGGGVVSSALVENADVGPTIVELAGGETTHEQFAASLVPALDGVTEVRDGALSEFRNEMMLVDRSWKAALNRKGEVYLLFDLEEDPAETRNLAGLTEFAGVEDDMRLRILERVARTQLSAPYGAEAIRH